MNKIRKVLKNYINVITEDDYKIIINELVDLEIKELELNDKIDDYKSHWLIKLLKL